MICGDLRGMISQLGYQYLILVNNKNNNSKRNNDNNDNNSNKNNNSPGSISLCSPSELFRLKLNCVRKAIRFYRILVAYIVNARYAVLIINNCPGPTKYSNYCRFLCNCFHFINIINTYRIFMTLEPFESPGNELQDGTGIIKIRYVLIMLVV